MERGFPSNSEWQIIEWRPQCGGTCKSKEAGMEAPSSDYRACWFPGALYLVLGEAYQALWSSVPGTWWSIPWSCGRGDAATFRSPPLSLAGKRYNVVLHPTHIFWYCTIPSHVVLYHLPLCNCKTLPCRQVVLSLLHQRGRTFERQEILSHLPALKNWKRRPEGRKQLRKSSILFKCFKHSSARKFWTDLCILGPWKMLYLRFIFIIRLQPKISSLWYFKGKGSW